MTWLRTEGGRRDAGRRRAAERRPRWLLLGLLPVLFGVGVACKREEPRAPATAASGPAESQTLLEPRHGGSTVAWSRGVAELVVDEAGLARLHLTGPDGEPVRPEGLKVTLRVPGQEPLLLVARAALFEGQGKPQGQGRPTRVVVLESHGDGASELLRFPAEGTQPQGAHHAGRPRRAGLEELAARVTDSTCLLRGEGQDEEHRECAIRCIHGGAAIALVEQGTGRIFVALAPPGQAVKDVLLEHVGSAVLLRGYRREQGGSQFFEVHEVHPVHDHSPLQGGAVGMAGDLHLEVLALQRGEVRVYLSDDFRRPLAATGQSGRVELRDGAGALREVPLRPDATGRYLLAEVGPLTAKSVELTAHLTLEGLGERYGVPMEPDEGFFMTFLVEPTADAAPGVRTAAAPAPTAAPPPERPSAGPEVKPAAKPAEVQEVRIEVSSGYTPSEVRLRKGVPARLVFVRKNSSECTRELLVPDLGIHRELAPLKETVVELLPEKAGRFEFTCGMRMLKGTLVVE